MNAQSSIFDYMESQRLKEVGIQLAADAEYDWVSRARSVAEHLASKNGECTINDVYAVVGLPTHSNAAGGIFRGKKWRSVGYLESGRVARRGGLIRRWSLRSGVA